jgi:hypothetical protein
VSIQKRKFLEELKNMNKKTHFIMDILSI